MAAIAGLNPDLRPARPGSIARFLIERWLADTID
jgi:NAD+ diphosphatase